MDTHDQELNYSGRRRRRRHSADFKAAVIQECLRPGISIAAVALAHGLNANMLRKWVIDAEHKAERATAAPAATLQPAGDPAPAFVPLALTPPTAAAANEIQIELRRAGATVKISWPAAAASECGAWLSDWLR